jgi:hypothetical protein
MGKRRFYHFSFLTRSPFLLPSSPSRSGCIFSVSHARHPRHSGAGDHGKCLLDIRLPRTLNGNREIPLTGHAKIHLRLIRS